MLLLCSKREYLESQWVQNEWSRFYAFGQNPATGKTIIPIFIDDFTPDRLPTKLQSYQGYPADYNLMDHLNRNLQAILRPIDGNAEVKAMEARLAEQQAAFEKQLAALRREMMQNNTPAPAPVVEPKPAPVAEPPKESAKGDEIEDAMAQMNDLLAMLEQAEKQAVEKEKKAAAAAPKKAPEKPQKPAKAEAAPALKQLKPKPKAIPLTPEQEAMLWVPGSGIGYSAHNNPPMSLGLACENLADLAKIEGGTPPGFSLAEKRKIAWEWREAKEFMDIHDEERILGVGGLSALKYKKYNKEYIEKLEDKFWS
jgi:chemotaxis protein histidine kinase CheA